MRQFVILDPPTKFYYSHKTLNTGIPSVVWREQMEKANIQSYLMHMIHKSFPLYKKENRVNFEFQFISLPEIVAYDTYFVDPQYECETYWNEGLFDGDKLEYKDTHNKPNDQFESNDLIRDSHVSDALRKAIFDLRTVNPQSTDRSPLPNFPPRPQNHRRQIAVIDNRTLTQLQLTPDGLKMILQISTILPLKNEPKM